MIIEKALPTKRLFGIDTSVVSFKTVSLKPQKFGEKSDDETQNE